MQNPSPSQEYPPVTGAFAVPASVTWEDGFGDDDLEVATPEPPVVPLRPGQLPSRTIRRTPVAAPVVQPAAPVAQQPAPVAQQPAPVAQQPAPIAQQPAPMTLAPVPLAPTRINDVDFTMPAWTQIKADPDDVPASSDWDAPKRPTAFNIPSGPPDVEVVAPASPIAPEPAPTRRKNPLTRKGEQGKKLTPTKRKASHSSVNGRGSYLAIRITVGVIMGFLLLVGVKHTVIGTKVPTADQMATEVAAKIGYNGFPRAAGDAFATRFASVYLTYNQATSDKRSAELLRYAPDTTILAWGWDGTGAQRVIQGPVVAGDPELLDKNNAIITVVAKLDRGSWVYLAIPIYTNGTGAMVVSGPPAYTSAPRLAVAPGKEAMQNLDVTLAGKINPDMVGFFTAWAASDVTALSRYTTTDATVPATTGLGGAFTLKDLQGLRIPSTGGDTRQGEADIDWAVPRGGQIHQSYRIVIQKLDTGRWFVKDIKGGLVSPAR
ncbi:MAG: conjugal transfer protein [Propionicimonas sp.]